MTIATRILVLGGSGRLIRKAAGLEVEIENLRGADDLEDHAAQLCAAVHVLDLQDTEAVVRLAQKLHAERAFDRVVCHSEPLQMLGGHLTDTLGVAGNSFATVSLMRDKYALRGVLRSRGLSSVASELVSSAAGLASFVERHGTAIAKPRSGGGSFGVSRVDSPQSAAAVWQWSEAVGLKQLLVEQEMKGPEISLEFFSVAGQHILLATTSKEVTDGFVELAHAVPAPVPDDQLHIVRELVASTLDTVGMTWGPSHTEVMMTEDGPEIVESHSRRAGNHINELVRLVHGVDMEKLVFSHASEPSFELTVPPADRAAAVRLLTADAGVVSGISGIAEALGSPGVVAAEVYPQIGEPVSELRWSADYIGHVIARGGDAAQAAGNAAQAATCIEVRVTSLSAPPDSSSPVLARHEALLGSAFDAFDASFDPPIGVGRTRTRHIAVLTGGSSNERDRSLLSGRCVDEALRSAGHYSTLVDTSQPDFVECIRDADVAFLAIAGTHAEDGKLQGLLEMMDIPYTGSGVLASALGMHKVAFKTFVAQLGLPVLADLPLDLSLSPGLSARDVADSIGFPVMLKPVSEGGSVGMTLIGDEQHFREVVATLDADSGVSWFVEKYCSGRSVTVGVLETADRARALPPLEVTTGRAFYDFESKRNERLHTYECPALVSEDTTAQMQRMAVQAHQGLGCVGYSRVDFVLAADDTPYLLEINTLPGLSREGNLATMSAEDGITYAELIEHILSTATSRETYVP